MRVPGPAAVLLTILAGLGGLALAPSAQAQVTQPVPMPPPPLPAAGHGAERAPQPRNPASWLSDADYPAAALWAGAQGLVRYVLEVDATGKVVRCGIAESSGSSLLDSATCALLRRRGRFFPALDAEGNAVPGRWAGDYRWVPTRD